MCALTAPIYQSKYISQGIKDNSTVKKKSTMCCSRSSEVASGHACLNAHTFGNKVHLSPIVDSHLQTCILHLFTVPNFSDRLRLDDLSTRPSFPFLLDVRCRCVGFKSENSSASIAKGRLIETELS